MGPITIEEIEYASRVLFIGNSTKFYDDIDARTGERVEAIQCLENKPIVACPGSGKTTVLLAKLIILANRMPFDDGRGICVLTHTNVAIDLIKKKLGADASKLFAYPNFFGTIQSFVDKFLATQSLIEDYGKRPNRVDKEISIQKLESEFNFLPWNSPLKNKLFSLIYASDSKLRIKDITQLLNVKYKESQRIINELKSLQILTGAHSPYNLNYNTNKEITKISNLLADVQYGDLLTPFFLKLHADAKQNAKNNESQFELLTFFSIDWELQKIIDNNSNFGLTTPSGIEFKKIKEHCFNEGIISYQDAYDFGMYYLFKHPEIGEAFQERFKFVFIDEMQDTATNQSKIIKTLFKGSDRTIVQEFGDPNQAIYDYDGQSGEWEYDEKNCLHLTKSKRFGAQIAKIINPLRIKTNDPSIEGENIDSTLPSHLIIFDKANETVLDEFGRLIIQYGLNKIQDSNFVAIGRVGKEKEDGKITLKTYWDGFEKESTKKKEHYPTLIEYLAKDLPDRGNYAERIVNGILQLLDQQDFKLEVIFKDKLQKRRFTKTTLFDYLKKENDELYYEFKTFISTCGLKIKNAKENYNLEVYHLIVAFINSKILPIKKIKPDSKIEFLKIPDNITTQNQQGKKTSIYEYKDDLGNVVPIKINTIHGEKGETHTATLFLETYYKKKHDSERISKQLIDEQLEEELNEENQMAAKLSYVAMSRPEKLLCFAVSSERISEEFARTKLEPIGWKI